MSATKIRVKLVSEAAGYITVSHVVQRDFSLAELVELMLPVLGGDAPRIRQILRAGTLSTGDYRYRWEPFDVDESELRDLLQAFPAADPSRAFDAAKCFLVRFRRGLEVLNLPRERAERKPLFGRQSFWDGLLALAASFLHYADYSHADRADVFTVQLDSENKAALHRLLPLLKPKSAAERLEHLRPEQIDLLCSR